jgi:hypothetical protein
MASIPRVASAAHFLGRGSAAALAAGAGASWCPSSGRSRFRSRLPEARPEPEPRGPQLPPTETRNRVAVLVPTSAPMTGVGQSIANAANLALLDSRRRAHPDHRLRHRARRRGGRGERRRSPRATA